MVQELVIDEADTRIPTGARNHPRLMLYAPTQEEVILQENWVVLAGATALDSITIAYGMRSTETEAVRRLFRHREGTKYNQDYGADPVTQERTDALWRLLETFCMVASGIQTQDSPRGIPKKVNSFTNAQLYPSAAAHYGVFKTTIPSNPQLTVTNVQTPLLEKPVQNRGQGAFH